MGTPPCTFRQLLDNESMNQSINGILLKLNDEPEKVKIHISAYGTMWGYDPKKLIFFVALK